MYVDVDEEYLDDDFFRELNAVEAAAAHSRAETQDLSSHVTDNSTSGDAPMRKSAANIARSVPKTPAQSAPAALLVVSKSSPGDSRWQDRKTSEPGTRMPQDIERCSQGCTVSAAGSRPFGGIEPTYEYQWEVKTISVRDGSAAAEEDVGKGSLTVRCRQESDGALVLLNAVVTAAGGGSAMDIPREAITRLSNGQPELSLPSDSPALESPVVLLELGIGCTLALSGLVRRGEQWSAECSGAEKTLAMDTGAVGRDTVDMEVAMATAVEVANMGAGGGEAGGAMPPLTAATPERRHLAPTEFLTPSPTFANQGGSNGRIREEAAGGGTGNGGEEALGGVGSVVRSPPTREPVPCPGVSFDPVLAKLIRDSHSNSATTTTTTATTTPTTPTIDMPETSSATTKAFGGQPARVGTAGHWGGGLTSTRGAFDGQSKRTGDGNSEQAVSPSERVAALAAGDSSPVVKGSEAGLVGDRSDGGGGGGGGSGSGSRGSGGGGGDGGGGSSSRGKGDRKPVIALHGELDVPDEEWRRPPVASPEKRRRTGAVRRRPNVRDGSTKRCVVLSLDGPGGGGNPDGRAGGADTRSRGAGEEEAARRRRSRKRPLEGSGESSTGWTEGGKASPSSPPPQRRAGGKVEGSWLTLRKALHERYRDLQEDGAAEQAASKADRGSGSKGSGWGGEVLLPGLRVFRRQEQAFTYADALEARLAPDDAARYKVLSFETSSTGSRKFLVCDVRRFEEHYPYTAAPDQHVFPPARVRRPCPRPPPQPTAPPPLTEQGSDSAGAQCAPAGPGVGSEGGAVGDDGQRLPMGTTRPAPRPSPLWHVYEIIREGSPCRMYFDLEFARAYNPGLDGEGLVRAWINVVAGKLHQDFGVSVGGSNFLDLDSSTPKKFSRHLVLHLPGGQLFRDNSHVGRFVNSLAADLESWRPSSSLSPSAPNMSDGERSEDATAHPHPAIPTPTSTPAKGDAEFRNDDVSRSVTTPMATPDGTDAGVLAASCAVSPCKAPAAALRSGLSSGAGSERETAEDGAPQCGEGDAAHSAKGLDAGGAAVGAAAGGGGGGAGGALESLWVNDGSGRTVLFADVSVYTRNRCFRLLGSRKYGKSAALKVAISNERTLDRMEGKGARQSRDPRGVARTVLHDSFVVPASLRSRGEVFLIVDGEGQHRYSRYGRAHCSPQHQQSTRVGASDKNRSDGLRVMTGAGGGGGGIGGEARGHGQQDSVGGGGDGGWGVTGSGFGSSPFPAVDSFLRTLICQGGPRGDLRQWSYTAEEISRDDVRGDDMAKEAGAAPLKSVPAAVTRKLTHQIANNRWCWNIGRAHKSNHVYLVTDLSSGEVCQRCHDQECRRLGYRSRPVRLPPAVAPSVEDLEAYELELGVAAAMRESPTDWAAVL